MQVQVNTDDHIHGGESLAQWITDESKSRLSRFQDHITRLEVFLTDLDAGKSGANDKRCRIEARVTGRQPVTVTDEADKMANAFIGAVDKLAAKIIKGGSGVWGAVPMPPNASVNEADAKKLAEWIMGMK